MIELSKSKVMDGIYLRNIMENMRVPKLNLEIEALFPLDPLSYAPLVES